MWRGTRALVNVGRVFLGRSASSQTPKELEATAGRMEDVKSAIIKKLGIQTSYSRVLNSRQHLLPYLPKNADDLPPRCMQDSFTSAIIPLESDAGLREKYVTFMGTLRLGRLLEDLDLFAVWVVHQHLKLPNHDPNVPLPYTFVTVLVDQIDFTEIIPTVEQDVRLSGFVSWVGKSSVEVVVWLEQKKNGAWQKITRALFLMAARNATNTKSASVNLLIPKGAEEEKIFSTGEERKQRRKAIQQETLYKTEPSAEETKIIHQMFVNSTDVDEPSVNCRILPANSCWMEDSSVSTTIFSHPEDRNAHNTVFGGFLMRNALELSWATVFKYCQLRPKLEHISDIAFRRPVDVSSLIKMDAHVIYTENRNLEVGVFAEVFNPTHGKQETTNLFYFTYSVSGNVPNVVPKTYHEAMWYLEGRRKFRSAKGLEAGRGLDTTFLTENVIFR